MELITYRPNRIPNPTGSRMDYNLQDFVISSYNVPDFIGSNDKVIDVYHDRVPYEFFLGLCEKYFNLGPVGLRHLQGKEMLSFVQELFKGDWTEKYEGINGARITEFTNRSNGHPIFYIEAYILDPKNKERIQKLLDTGKLTLPLSDKTFFNNSIKGV